MSDTRQGNKRNEEKGFLRLLGRVACTGGRVVWQYLGGPVDRRGQGLTPVISPVYGALLHTCEMRASAAGPEKQWLNERERSDHQQVRSLHLPGSVWVWEPDTQSLARFSFINCWLTAGKMTFLFHFFSVIFSFIISLNILQLFLVMHVFFQK